MQLEALQKSQNQGKPTAGGGNRATRLTETRAPTGQQKRQQEEGEREGEAARATKRDNRTHQRQPKANRAPGRRQMISNQFNRLNEERGTNKQHGTTGELHTNWEKGREREKKGTQKHQRGNICSKHLY